jgi:YwiC-like protein
MTSTVIADPARRFVSSQPKRLRALVVPREHGAWGLLFVPLFTGVAVGAASTHQAGALVLFALAALSLFWLRTPVESLLGTTPLSAQTSEERLVSLLAAAGSTALAAGCVAGLFWNARNRDLVWFGGAGVAAFLIQTLLMRAGRKFRMSAQLVGAIGLTCTAPAAYYVATGSLDERAWLLWAANWIFAGNQIHFVQLRIHAARAASFSEKLARGHWFLLGQAFLLIVLLITAHSRLMPALIVVAFLPALARGFYWFVRKAQPLQVKSLGWSEMRQGVLFGILLVAANVFS